MTQTEEQLIERAIQVIDQIGYQNLSLRQLTGALGLTTGAFYKHFRSKDELFQKITVQLSQEFAERIVLNDNLAENQLLQVADYFVDQMQTHPKTMEFLFFNDQAVDTLKKADQDYPFLSKIKQLVHVINLNSNLSDQDFFIQIWSFIQGYSLLIKNGATTYNPALVKRTLIQMMKEVD
jgi:AcrR family transcriptional regulator